MVLMPYVVNRHFTGERGSAPAVSRSASAQEAVQDGEKQIGIKESVRYAQETIIMHELQAQTCRSRLFDTNMSRGVHLSQYISGMPCTYSIGARVNSGQEITRCLRFDPRGSGKAIWRDLKNNGVVTLGYGVAVINPLQNNNTFADGLSPQFSTRLGVAVSVSATVTPSDSATMDFVLAWDMPLVQFGRSSRVYRRRYTRYFGAENDAGDR